MIANSGIDKRGVAGGRCGWRGFLLVLAACALIGGCAASRYSEAPIAKNFPIVSQLKPQSSAHWKLIANDVVAQLVPVVGNEEVFVVPAKSGETEFSQVLRGQVISAMTDAGIAVLKRQPANADSMTLQLESRLLRFAPGRVQSRYIVSATAIVAGIWALHGMELFPETALLLGSGGAAAAFDWNNWYGAAYPGGHTPEYELVVTASLGNASKILSQRTNVYYISDVDVGLYSPPPPQQGIPVRGGI